MKVLRAMTFMAGCSILALAAVACSGGQSSTATPAVPPTAVLPVTLRNFAFEPRVVAVKAGDTVEFEMRSRDDAHTFTVRGLGIDWAVRAGGRATRRFTFTQAGEFRLVCTVSGHEAAGMVGALRVE